MSVEVRRKAAENAFLRAQAAGRAVEQDESFHAWIEEWIAGQVEMPEVARRYRALLSERSARRRSETEPLAKHNPDAKEAERPYDLETEIERLMHENQPDAKV